VNVAQRSITSPANPEIKSVAALRQRTAREQSNRFLIEGETEIHRAVGAGIDIETIYGLGDVDTSYVPQGTRVVTVSDRAMAKISYGRDGILAVARAPRFDLAALRLGKTALVVVVEGLEKPGNLGAVLRCADATGAAVIVADPKTDLTNPNVVRASLGTLFTVPVASTSLGECISFLSERHIRIAATTVERGIAPWEANLSRPVAIFIGSETKGLSEKSMNAAEVRLTLPMKGTADSLNAAVTAGVILYEALRQRTQQSMVHSP
jgi:TrmH family RNA methyltransferase